MDRSKAFLDGRSALVTGAGAGIGRGIALAFADFGARVAVLDIDAERTQQTADAITDAGGEALALPTDVRDGEAFEAAVHRSWGDFDGIDILVNNVGGVFAAPFLETNERGWDALHRANLKHIYHGCRSVGTRMVERGAGGSIINVVSIEGVRAAPLFAAYSAAKAGAINFTQTLALELAPHGIRVNALAPDLCDTEGIRAMSGGAEPSGAMVPLGRPGVPEDLGGAAVFLASDMASYVTGICLHVDGGTHAAGGWYRHPEGGHYVLGPTNSMPRVDGGDR